MSAQMIMTEAERTAIEKEITELYESVMEASENVDISATASIISDEYNLGFIDSGEFFNNSQDITEVFKEGFSKLERQETLDRKEYRLAVLAPDIVVGTDQTKTAVYHKDGSVFTGNFALTFVIVKIDGEWKVIHSHQSVQPVEE
jgi:uncharacterized protein (TIGR02246 family)